MNHSADEPRNLRLLCDDLRAECQELDELLETSAAGSIWSLATRFHHWRVWDEIAHLHLFDELALLALSDHERFMAERRSIETQLAEGAKISGLARERFAALPNAAIAPHWRAVWKALADELAELDPKARLPWFGPDMSARSFVTARMMETWAHGQDVWDALERRRPPSPRLAHIAQLGVLTFGWSFANRGRRPPGPMPQVHLSGPLGESWHWGEPTSTERISGSALDFCLVVTQRRHVQDTHLEVHGETATEWMLIAQCFAGPAASAPPPGSFPR